MVEELKALDVNNTCTVVSLPNGKHTVGCRWIYKIKYHSNGRYKARLVAKGYVYTIGWSGFFGYFLTSH